MYFKSKKISLLILGITSIIVSRTLFLLFDDPEGPNLFVVLVTATIIYGISLPIYVSNRLKFSLSGLTRIFVVIFIQIALVIAFYFCLR